MGDSIVYYIRRDGLIKIGFTTRFERRMHVLRPDAVLAVEPGDLALETARHFQFAAFRTPHACSREWYSPTSELLAHVEGLARVYGVPALPAFGPKRTPGLTRTRPGRVEPPDATFEALSHEDLCKVVDATRPGSTLLQVVVAELNRRGITFAQIGAYYGVTESTASRWAKPGNHS